MPRCIIERTVGVLTRDQLEAAARESKRVLAEMRDVIWIKSYISEAEGKIYCEYDAPNPEAVREHGRRCGLPVDTISLVTLEISPEMFV
jgi:hypothetical protein